MDGVAAGRSTFGYVPFVSSFAMFAAGRASEQIRNSIGYPELNVKIAATHGGLSVGEDGASHQCCLSLIHISRSPATVRPEGPAPITATLWPFGSGLAAGVWTFCLLYTSRCV